MPGAPQDPSQAQDPSQGQGDDQGQSGQDLGQVGQLINGIHNDMLELAQFVEQAKLPPEDMQNLQVTVQSFQKFVQGLMQDAQSGGGGGQPEAAGPQGSAPQPMQQGRAKVQPANF